MTKLIQRLAFFPLLIVFVVLIGHPARAQTPPPPALTPTEVEKIVHDYLLTHPEVIVDALKKYQAQQEAATLASQRVAMDQVREELLNSPGSPIGGNPQGSVTLVEFFDYRCPYCKTVAGPLAQTLAAQPDVKIIYKEYPILSPQSVEAAKAALASHKQGKYETYHRALMAHRGNLDLASLLDIARKTGLDIEQLKKDMNSPDIGAELRRNTQLAEQLKITGTPSFVVGNHIIPGAIEMDELTRLLGEQRG